MYNIHAQTQLPISQAKVGEPFSENLEFFSTRGTRLGQNLKFFSKKLLLMTPLRKKIKEQRCETAAPCCAQFVNFSLKSNSRLVITSTYRLLKSIYCTVGNYLTFHHLLTLFPSVQGVLLQSYQSILPSLPS